MPHRTSKIKQILLICVGVFAVFSLSAQVPTYTIDEAFDCGEVFSAFGPVSDLHILSNGKILVGGYFDNEFLNGLGMIYPNGQLDNSWAGNEVEYYNVLEIIAQEDGYVYPTIYSYTKLLLDGTKWGYVHQDYWSEYLSGGTFSPYNVERVWDIYQMENGDLLLGGAIANDTLQPNVFRGIARIHADGSHDPTFPVLNITPNNQYGAVQRIFRALDGAWYIAGGFTAINGHETNRIARLTPEFEVDTTFVSPFIYDGYFPGRANVILVDNQSRVWVSGDIMRLQDNPTDTIQMIRLLANGEVDETFSPKKLKITNPVWADYTPNIALGAQEIVNHPGNYFIYGYFDLFQDTLQPSITVVNDAGVIQSNFFQGQGAEEHQYSNINNQIYYAIPDIRVVKQLPDGGLLIGGGFSQFMGEERYSVVKLKPDSITATPPGIERAAFKVYPNPAIDVLNLSGNSEDLKSGTVYNAIGQEVISFPFKTNENQVDIRRLEPGIYFVKVQLDNGQVGVRKFVKQ